MERKQVVSDLTSAISGYLDLITSFLNDDITPLQFSERFSERYLADDSKWSEAVFDEMDGLWSVCNDYVDDPQARTSAFATGPDELTMRATRIVEHAGFDVSELPAKRKP